MGCDIHLYVETRTAQGWKSIDAWSREEGEPRDVAHEDRFYTGRNYSLFEMLANVRGAGLLPPISEPKGLPDDVSAEVRGTSDAWGCDGHSHSFLTLRELSGYDWGAATSPEMPWARTRGEAAGDFYIKTMPRLRALSGDGAGDDVRIVFFFDN